ncbi:hypothetical protein AB4865_07300 [Capnocytophaga sp. ARDL2]|uniref:hypothetical protein n=1 Tax=Capnocytophaga sp. ARDL2 TaxID=3238809 RepID=UPI0035569815
MNKTHFKLSVPIGTRIISGSDDIELTGVPDTAWQSFMSGAQWLRLTDEAVTALANESEEQLKTLINMRQRQAIQEDVAILVKALEEKRKTSEPKATKPKK